MPSFIIDDNDKPLVDVAGLRPGSGSANIISVTLSGSVQEPDTASRWWKHQRRSRHPGEH
jgi:hypothetical protein